MINIEESSRRPFHRERPALFAVVAVAFHLFAVACAIEEPEAPGAENISVRDSAGIQIVVNEPDPRREMHLVGSSPHLRIGNTGGDEPTSLFNVTGALKTINDEIVIANSGSAELRFFDMEGSYLRAAGGSGSGPGEFESLKQLIAYRTDSIAAYDWASRRISVWGATGEFGRTIALMPMIQEPAELVGALSDGSFIVSRIETVRREDRVREEIAYLQIDPEGNRAPRPFATTPSAAVFQEQLLIGNGESFQIRVIEPSGEVLKIIRKNVEADPVSPEDEDAFKQMMLSYAPSPEARRDVEASFSDIVFPSFKPSYVTFMTGQSEHLWVLDHPSDFEADHLTWSVFDAAGHLLGTVQIPAIIVMNGTIGPDFVLGVAHDDLGVEYVELYHLRNPDS